MYKKKHLVLDRDTPIDRPVIGISRFHTNPFIASGAGRDVTATCTLTVDITVASIHIVSREDNSNSINLILIAFSVNGD